MGNLYKAPLLQKRDNSADNTTNCAQSYERTQYLGLALHNALQRRGDIRQRATVKVVYTSPLQPLESARLRSQPVPP
jgi:hypothetical protein